MKIAALIEIGMSQDEIDDVIKESNGLEEQYSYYEFLINHGSKPETIREFYEQGVELCLQKAALELDELQAKNRRDSGSLYPYFKPLTQFVEQEATWLIPGWIPEGQITLLAADGGVGKTTLWCHIIAALSNGNRCFLDPPDFSRHPTEISFLTTEDSIPKKLLRKLRISGACAANIYAPDFSADKSGFLRKLKFGTSEMENYIRNAHSKLIVFDPIQGFLPPALNMGSRNAMRDCLAPLISIGEETGTSFLIVAHTNKRKGAYGRDRIADSADLWDISRSVLMSGYTDEQGIRYLSNEKNNYVELQETLLFSIDQNGLIESKGTTWKRDREFMQDAVFSTSISKREDCKAWLLSEINASGGSMSMPEVEDKARESGYSDRTLRRSKEELKKDGKVRYFAKGSARSGNRIWYIQATGKDV